MTAHSLLERFLALRAATEALAAPLSGEDQVIQSMPNTSPTKWHRAHTTWFFETFLLVAHAPNYTPFDPNFGFLFNSYYVSVGERHARHERGMVSRPSISEIASYREHVDTHMAQLLASDPASDVLELVELGIQHEQQHQELLLADIKHAFSCNPIEPAYVAGSLEPSVKVTPEWQSFDGGLVQVGHHQDGFCFDNEQPRHQVFLEPFELRSSPVTNGEWLQFMEAGGYADPGLWLSEGWAHIQETGWEHPLYWQQSDAGAWNIFTLSGTQALDPNEPVSHVSFVEADAFARWAGGQDTGALRARLPTEFEWEHAADQQRIVGNFLESGRFHPGGAHSAAEKGGYFGDVWEWTASPYVGYPGFQVAPGAVGEYNGKFMLNQQVLRGGCTWSPQSHLRAGYRNFYPTTTRWHCSGLRLAR